jgi:serine/threonine-protein kinase HipA
LLGGARPKATFQDEDGSLWIARFPSRSDEWDVAAWEFTMHQLAAKAGITVPSARLIRLSGAQRTFIAQRFDRSGSERHLFASAMTLTSQRDHDPETSYLDIAEAITDYVVPAAIDSDLGQLFAESSSTSSPATAMNTFVTTGFSADRAAGVFLPALT